MMMMYYFLYFLIGFLVASYRVYFHDEIAAAAVVIWACWLGFLAIILLASPFILLESYFDWLNQKGYERKKDLTNLKNSV